MNGSDELQDYDPVQAKFCASLLWFVCRVSEHGTSEIPPEITSPVEITATNALIVRPAVSDYLSSGQMYLTVGSVIFKQKIATLWDLIQNMSNNGVYVMDENEEAVTDLDLMEKFPFKLFSHLALMDSMMLLYSNNQIAVENIVNVVRKFSNFNASKELPFDLEDALLLWINKINQANMNDCNTTTLTTIQKVRLPKDQLIEKKVFPQVHELVDIVKDCKALLSILLYYLPEILRFEDIKLSSTLPTDDRIHNIELFRSICAEHVCTSVFALCVEDFLYANEHLKSNFLTLLCEIFYELEIDTSKRRSFAHNVKKLKPTEQHGHTSSEGPQHTTGVVDNNELRSKPSQRQPLLSKRSKQQFARFETELSEDMSNPAKTTAAVHQAWTQNNEETANKKQIISLDFRPTSGSSIKSSNSNQSSVNPEPIIHSFEGSVPGHPRSSWTANATYPSLPTDTHQHAMFDPYHHQQPHKSVETKPIIDSYEDQLKNISMSSRFSQQRFPSNADHISTESSRRFDPHNSHNSPSKQTYIRTNKCNDTAVREDNLVSTNANLYDRNNLSYNDGVKLVEDARMIPNPIRNVEANMTNLSTHNKPTKPSQEIHRYITHQNSQHQQQHRQENGNNSPRQQQRQENGYNSPRQQQRPENVTDNRHVNPYVFTHVGLDHPDEMTDCDDDDVLSTITEGTEPDAPSLYSFHSSSSSSTKYNSSEERLNFIKEGGGGFFIDDFHTGIYENQTKTSNYLLRSNSNDSTTENNLTLTKNNLNQIDSSVHTSEGSPRISHGSNQTNVVRGSYIVGQGTVESALATGIPIITDSVKYSYDSNQTNSPEEFHYIDLASSQEISAKQSDDTVTKSRNLVSISDSVQSNGISRVVGPSMSPDNQITTLTPDCIEISPHSEVSPHEFDDAPLDLPHPGGNSQSSNSRSSSSGISVDDGRFHSGSDTECRPGVTVYSSLSEQTNASPIERNSTPNDDLTIEANDDENKENNLNGSAVSNQQRELRANYPHQDQVMYGYNDDNQNVEIGSVQSSPALSSNDKDIPKGSSSSVTAPPPLLKKKSVLEEKDIFDINKALMEIGKDKDLSVVENTLVEMNQNNSSPKNNRSEKHSDSLEKLISSKENSPLQNENSPQQSENKPQQNENNKSRPKNLSLTMHQTILKDTLKKIELFTTGGLTPSYDHWPFKKTEKQDTGKIDFMKNGILSPAKITWADVKPNKRKVRKQTEAELKLKQLRDSYKKSQATLMRWTDFVKERRLSAEIADEGKVDRKKCYEKLQIDDDDDNDEAQSENILNTTPSILNETSSNYSNNQKSMNPLHETNESNTMSNHTAFYDHVNNNDNHENTGDSITLRAQKPRKNFDEKRSTYVLESSPIKSSKDAALQGIPIIEALGDLCVVADNFLKDYSEDESSSTLAAHSDNSTTPSRHSILENEINDKVNEILDSFQQLDHTVDMLTQNAMKKHEHFEYKDDDVIVTSAKFPTNDNDIDKEAHLPNYDSRTEKLLPFNLNLTSSNDTFMAKNTFDGVDFEPSVLSINCEADFKLTTSCTIKEANLRPQSSTNRNIPHFDPSSFLTQSETTVASPVTRRQNTRRSARPSTFIVPETSTFSSDIHVSSSLKDVHKPDDFLDSISLNNNPPKSPINNLNSISHSDNLEQIGLESSTANEDMPTVVTRTLNKYSMNSGNRGTFVISSTKDDSQNMHAENNNENNHLFLSNELLKMTNNLYADDSIDQTATHDTIDGDDQLYDSDSTVDGDVENNDRTIEEETNVIYRKSKSYIKSPTNRGTFVLSKNTQEISRSTSDLPNEISSQMFHISPPTPTSPLKSFNTYSQLERSSSYTNLSNSTSNLSAPNQPKYFLMSQSLYDLKQVNKSNIISGSFSTGLLDRTQSQPVLNELGTGVDTRRKTSVGNVMTKLDMLQKVMSTSLSKLTELHTLRREINLSNSSVDTINNDEEIPQKLVTGKFSLSGSVDNYLGSKSLYADDHKDIIHNQAYQRSISAPNDGEQLYHDMMRQHSSSSGGTYTLISPPYDIVEKDSSLVLIDMNDTDDEESSEKVYLHSFVSKHDHDPNTPRSYHFESDFMTSPELADEMNADLMNVEDIIRNLEYQWSDKIDTASKRDFGIITSSNDNSNKRVEGMASPNESPMHQSKSLYKHFTLDNLSSSFENENEDSTIEERYDVNITDYNHIVQLRERKETDTFRRVGTYILETSDDIELDRKSGSLSPDSPSHKNLANDDDVKSFLRERPGRKQNAGTGTYVLENETPTAEQDIVDIDLDEREHLDERENTHTIWGKQVDVNLSSDFPDNGLDERENNHILWGKQDAFLIKRCPLPIPDDEVVQVVEKNIEKDLDESSEREKVIVSNHRRALSDTQHNYLSSTSSRMLPAESKQNSPSHKSTSGKRTMSTSDTKTKKRRNSSSSPVMSPSPIPKNSRNSVTSSSPLRNSNGRTIASPSPNQNSESKSLRDSVKRSNSTLRKDSLSNANEQKHATSDSISMKNKASSLPNSPALKSRLSNNSSPKKPPTMGKKSSSFTEGEHSTRTKSEKAKRRSTLDRNTTFIKKEAPSRRKTSFERSSPERSTYVVPKNKEKATRRNSSNSSKGNTTKAQIPLHEPQSKTTSPKHRNFLKRTSTSYTDKMSPRKEIYKTKKDHEVGEPLTERLASLRVQLEQKRLKFEEEKKRQQLLWNQERAKMLQDAFFVMINGKENKDPSLGLETTEIVTTPSKQGASWEVQFDKDDESAENKVEEPEEKEEVIFESPRDFIQRKREEKKKMMESEKSRGLWFVGFDDEETKPQTLDTNDEKEVLKNEIKTEKQKEDINSNVQDNYTENRKITEEKNQMNSVTTHVPVENVSHQSVDRFQTESVQPMDTREHRKVSSPSGSPPTGRKLTPPQSDKYVYAAKPDISRSEPALNIPTEEDTLSQNISKSLSKLKALSSNTSEIIAKSAEMSDKIETRIQQKDAIGTDYASSHLVGSNLHSAKQETPVVMQIQIEQKSTPSLHSSANDLHHVDVTPLLHAESSVIPETSQMQMDKKEEAEEKVVVEQSTVASEFNSYAKVNSSLPDIAQSSVFTDQSTLQNHVGQTYVVGNTDTSVAKQPINNYVPDTTNSTVALEKRFEQFSVNEISDTSYLTSTPMKLPIIRNHEPQVEVKENIPSQEEEVTDEKHTETQEESDMSTTPKTNAWGFSYGDEFSTENKEKCLFAYKACAKKLLLKSIKETKRIFETILKGLTPDQKRKKERFLKNRMKRMEESKRKKEEENEKKLKKDEQLALDKAREEAEEKIRQERLMAEKLAEATSQLQHEDFSKRLHGMTYNMDLQPTNERSKEPRQPQPLSQRNIRAISPTVKQQHQQQQHHQQQQQQQQHQQRTMSPIQQEETNTNFYSEYKGPAAYQKPSGKSNRKIIQNAIMHCCLCGEVNKDAKQKCLEALSQSDASHFLVLFREGLKFRSIYEYRPEVETVTKIYGIGPKSITAKMHSCFYKYNSGGKQFNSLDTKHLSITVDGLMIKKELWEKKPPNSLNSKTNSNLRRKPPTR